MAEVFPYIPEYITVHLGTPNSYAENVKVSFPDYVKNVASSEIYPTWPEAAIRANMYAQISFALNRVYTEWYKSKGYNFDITNTTQNDQAFVYGREIFDNISKIADDIFNDYVIKGSGIVPYFTQYCNGTTSTCDGLSQWGTVDLANQGMTPYEILKYYYGDDVYIVEDAPIMPLVQSYPGSPLRLGSAGNNVAVVQYELERIRKNYPAIPKIGSLNFVFDSETEAAVKEFQKIFNLTSDGVVGKATWYKLKYIYNTVKGLGELASESVTAEELKKQYPKALKLGSEGFPVKAVQYYLDIIGYFYPTVPNVEIDGVFGPKTEAAVKAFQNAYGLEPDGRVGKLTWEGLVSAYGAILETTPSVVLVGDGESKLYPGYAIKEGMSNEYVRELQIALNAIADTDSNIPDVEITGYFGSKTKAAVSAIQKQYGLPVIGFVDMVTWGKIQELYAAIVSV